MCTNRLIIEDDDEIVAECDLCGEQQPLRYVDTYIGKADACEECITRDQESGDGRTWEGANWA